MTEIHFRSRHHTGNIFVILAMVLIADCYKQLGLTDLEQDMRRVIAGLPRGDSLRRAPVILPEQ